jgi:hypothetical protein
MPVMTAPPPPPGPGVRPPFVAPPTDGSRHRRTVAITVSITLAFVLLIGAAVGFFGLVALGERVIVDGTKGVVTRYLTAVQHNDYVAAYRLLCADRRSELTETEFARSYDGAPPILGFTVGDPPLENSDEFFVPVTVRNPDGERRLTFGVVQDRQAGIEFRVCDAPR